MTELKDVMAYIIANYPFKGELSNARLTKMIYLTDWKNALLSGRQVTDISWRFVDFGPFVRDIQDTAINYREIFNSIETTNQYGVKKLLITLNDPNFQPNLSPEEKKVIDHVIEKTKRLNWNDFIRLIYSTYPILKSERYSDLNLIKFAKEYQSNNFSSELV
ncbi:MAG: Panacea domain-containing protein [Methanoregula sp.]|nr:Panacea domain-containing protein [Methanoregula sp.]